MNNLIGRPRDPITDNMKCPKCGKNTLRKAGMRDLFNEQGTKRVQAYRCKECHFTTTKPQE